MTNILLSLIYVSVLAHGSRQPLRGMCLNVYMFYNYMLTPACLWQPKKPDYLGDFTSFVNIFEGEMVIRSQRTAFLQIVCELVSKIFSKVSQILDDTFPQDFLY